MSIGKVDITRKSTGFLIDEWITSDFKVEVKPTPENIKRRSLLKQAIDDRVEGRYDLIETLITELRLILRSCWNAQEVVMSGKTLINAPYVAENQWMKIAIAGITAQQTNVQRNNVIREIDEILGEYDTTVLTKTY